VSFATEHNEWAPDHSLLLSKPDADGALREGGLAVMGYSSSKHTYTYHILKSTGDSEDLQGTVEDRTWTWLSDELRTGGESTKPRITMKEISPTSYALRVETVLVQPEMETELSVSEYSALRAGIFKASIRPLGYP
jgi:hypothetical protein